MPRIAASAMKIGLDRSIATGRRASAGTGIVVVLIPAMS